jgi:hypothetical protein
MAAVNHSLLQSHPSNVIVGEVKDEIFIKRDTTQRFPIGTIYQPDERSFSYAYAGATLNSDMGCESADFQHIGYVSVAEDTVIGAKELILDTGASTGASGDGSFVLNELVNGTAVIFDKSQSSFCRRIVGSSVVASGGGEMTIKLDQSMGVALIGDTDKVECVANRFIDVRTGANASKSIVGIPEYAATVGQYVWIQTWGPRWFAIQGAVGGSNNDREIVFRHDGSGDQHDYNDANTKFGQHAGWNMANAIGGAQGAPFVYLKISRA